MYSHSRSEDMLVHHRDVATPRDPITAHMGEHFHRYFHRVLSSSFLLALEAEAAILARKDLPFDRSWQPFLEICSASRQLPFTRFYSGRMGWGWTVPISGKHPDLAARIGQFYQHYGLTRKHLGKGKYEHVQPRHSWNTTHKASNWLLINLQRHPDHHYKPDCRYPILKIIQKQMPHS